MTTSYRSNENSTAMARVGLRVMSADGKQLGIVKEVHDDCFLVDARWAPDYWLGTETIEAIVNENVQLTLARTEVGSAKLRREIVGPGLGKDAADFNGPSPADRPRQSL